MSEAISWPRLRELMQHGPQVLPTVRGVVRSNDDGAESWDEDDRGAPRAWVGAVSVWRDAGRVRIAWPDRCPQLIAGDSQVWQFSDRSVLPVVFERTAARLHGWADDLWERRAEPDWMGDDFTRPTGPAAATTFLGRQAWAVELAPPAHKPYPIQWIIDAETGLVLQQRNDGVGLVEEWAEFVTGESFDASLFTWEGPARSDAEVQAEMRAEREADVAGRAYWFAENVRSEPLHVEQQVLIPFVHHHCPDGSFEASIEVEQWLVLLARRPALDRSWELHWGEDIEPRRWTQDGWDWAIGCEAGLPASVMEALWCQLGPD